MFLLKFDFSFNFEFIIFLIFCKFGYVESFYFIGYERKVVKESINIFNEVYFEVEGFSFLFKVNKWIFYVEIKYGVYLYYLMGEGFKNVMIIVFLVLFLKGGYFFIDFVEVFYYFKFLRVMFKIFVKGVK